MKVGQRFIDLFARLREEKRAGLGLFIMAGDPDFPTSAEIASALAEAGADLLEIGLPFSDPVADGSVIQAAASRALAQNCTKKQVFSLIHQIRTAHPRLPLVLMGYTNMMVDGREGEPVDAGAESFANTLAEAGGDGVIAVDLPFEESDVLRPALNGAGLALIPLAAPTTGAERLQQIAETGQGFLYYISILGITGSKTIAREATKTRLAELRQQTSLPLATGFGIRTPDDVRAMAGSVDLAIVGTALVDAIHKAAANGENAPEAAAALIRPMIEALAH